MKKMQRRGKLEKDGSKKGGKDGKPGDGSSKGGGSSGGKSGKENFEGTESVASHEDGFVDRYDFNFKYNNVVKGLGLGSIKRLGKYTYQTCMKPIKYEIRF